MKSFFLSLVAVLALSQLAQADVTVKLTKVHLCCTKCVNGAKKAISAVDGVTPAIDKDTQTISLTAPDLATAQKAVNALTKAGFFGVTEDTGIKIDASTGACGFQSAIAQS